MDLPARLIAGYRGEFAPDETVNHWLGGGELLVLLSFEESVHGYFNRDLARAMALADWAVRNLDDRYEVAYLLEDAINRHCACWEYLFQMLSGFLGLDEEILPSKGGLEKLLGLSGYDIDFLPMADWTEVRYTPRSVRTAVREIRQRRANLGYLQTGARAQQFFDEVSSKYAPSTWLDELKRLVRDTPVKEIRNRRNSIAHMYALGARHQVNDQSNDGLPGATIVFSGHGFDGVPIMKTLKQAHQRLRKAIWLTTNAWYGADRPNIKKNDGKEYRYREASCPECGRTTCVPQPDPCEFFSSFYCQNCSLWSQWDAVDLSSAKPLPELVYGTLLRERIIDISRSSFKPDPAVQQR